MKARMGPSTASRGIRTSRRARRRANTAIAIHSSVWAAKIERRQVAASAAISPVCVRSRRAPVSFNARLTLDGGFFGEHDRDVVAHGVHALARAAAQPRAVL